MKSALPRLKKKASRGRITLLCPFSSANIQRSMTQYRCLDQVLNDWKMLISCGQVKGVDVDFPHAYVGP